MCGIAGIIGKPDRPAVERMLGCMVHRGPDDSGIFSDEFLTIGMNRLAIIDLSQAAHQPMRSDDGRYWIIYNGEVFNFEEIRRKLTAAGISFTSSSDTEVVLKAYIALGEKCLDLFRGMFAFLIYDCITRNVFSARDRFGIKPFYYAVLPNGLVFASELKALLASGYVDFQVNAFALQQFTSFGSVLPGDCMISNVKPLPPGNSLHYKDGSISIRQYWNLRVQPEFAELNYAEAKEQLVEKLKESVALRLISDRPVGLFLSSGIDSASILAATRLLNRTNVSTFTIGFADDGESKVRNEALEAQLIARKLGFSNETVVVHEDQFQNLLDDFVLAIDQPSIDGLNTFLITKFARKHLVVALSGLGGDELMNGYLRDRAIIDWHNSFSIFPDSVRKHFNALGYFRENTFSKIPLAVRLLKGQRSKDPVWNYFLARFIGPPSLIGEILNGENGGSALWPKIYKRFDNLRLPQEDGTVSQQVASLEINSFMSSQLLRDMDAVSMYNSMEVRFPLIDHQVAEFIYSLPDNFKINNNVKLNGYSEGKYTYEEYGAKRILVDSFKPYLPEEFFASKKRGFNIPLYSWLSKHVKQEIFDTLTSQNADQYFRATGIQRLLQTFQATGKVTPLLWAAFLFLKWEKTMKNIHAFSQTSDENLKS
jgi:asparagine synthase (glutamine-hydrolysing)